MKIKFNWVDAVIIVLILAIGVGGYLFLKARKSGGDLTATTKKLYFVFETDRNSKEIAEQFTEGTPVVFGTKKVDKGVIRSAVVSPYQKETVDVESGQWYVQDVPGLYVSRIVIEFDGYETDSAYKATQEVLAVGAASVVSGRGINSEGFILDVGAVE